MEVSSADEPHGGKNRPPFYFEVDEDARRGRENGWAEAALCASINRGRNHALMSLHVSGDREYLEHTSESRTQEIRFHVPGVLADIFQSVRYAGGDVLELINRALGSCDQQWAEAQEEVECNWGTVPCAEPLPDGTLAALKARMSGEQGATDRVDSDG